MGWMIRNSRLRKRANQALVDALSTIEVRNANAIRLSLVGNLPLRVTAKACGASLPGVYRDLARVSRRVAEGTHCRCPVHCR